MTEIFGKPSPSYFNEARRLLGGRATDIWIIGDDWQTDITGALKSGFIPLLIKSGKYTQGNEWKVPGTRCIDTLSEVFGYIS